MQPKITLYTIAPSQNAVRGEIALREKGLDFDKVEVDLFSGEHKQPPFSELTPRGQVPTLVYGEGDDKIVVYESIASFAFSTPSTPIPR